MANESPNTVISDERQDFYQRIGEHHMTPLWEVMKGLVLPEPNSPCSISSGGPSPVQL